jgi:hypothetical protein
MQRVPFSREALISSTDLLFQERGPATEWLTPGRDPGAVLGQAIRFTDEQDGPQLALRGGLFNGNGSALGDTDPGLLAVGRFEFAMGETYRTWSPDGEPAVGLGGSIAANPELATGNQLMNVDFLGRVWYLTAMAQLTTSTVSPLETTIVSPEVPAETKRRGILGQLSGFIPIEGAHGIEIGTRFASYDDSQAFEDNGDVWLLHSGVTWREPLPFLDLGAGFIHRHEPAGPAIANDSFRIWTQVRPSVKVAGS